MHPGLFYLRSISGSIVCLPFRRTAHTESISEFAVGVQPVILGINQDVPSRYIYGDSLQPFVAG